jgi:muconate cycloisomerase
MTIAEIEVFVVRWPFTMPVVHSLARNTATENIVVSITDTDGATGYGEGVPRRYVTGESTKDGLDFLKNHLLPRLVGLRISPDGALDVLPALVDDQVISRYPAACCATEIALLDLAGLVVDKPAHELVAGLMKPKIVYSAVVPIVDPKLAGRIVQIIAARDMREVKIKAGHEHDARIAGIVRDCLGPEIDLRVDANAAWSAQEALDRLEVLNRYDISSVEQPVAADDIAGLDRICAESRTRVLADESVCTPEQARTLALMHTVDGFNLKLSKCGGPGRALAMYRAAVGEGLVCMLGSQVGELGLLSAAGRHFAVSAPDLIHVEGCLTRFYVSRDIIVEDLTPGRGGEADALEGAGLGVTVDSAALNRSRVLTMRAASLSAAGSGVL